MTGNNTPPDILDTHCWANEIIRDPYRLIAELFSSTECWHLRGVIKRLLQYAISPAIYAGKSPCDVMLYMRMVSSAIRAAHELKDKACCGLAFHGDNLLGKKYYCSHYAKCDSWTDFPRFLSKKEYCNPCLVFRRFFKYQTLENWLTIWRNIVDGALCSEESRFFINEISVYTHLVKCMEAAHLIHVRETILIRGKY